MPKFRIVTPAAASFTTASGGYDYETEALQGLSKGSHRRRQGRALQFKEIFHSMHSDSSTYAWQLLLQAGSVREFMLSCRHLLFPPRAVMQQLYRPHSSLALTFCYVFRPFHLTARLGRVLYRQVVSRRRNLLSRGEKAPL